MAMSRSSFAQVATVLIFAVGFCVPIEAQSLESAPDLPSLQRRCETLSVTSDSPFLPIEFFGPLLLQRPEIQASKIVFVSDPSKADVSVKLKKSSERDTNIEASSQITGRRISLTSDWTSYPGMVASDVVGVLRELCPSVIGTIARPIAPHVAECP